MIEISSMIIIMKKNQKEKKYIGWWFIYNIMKEFEIWEKM